MTPMSFRYKRYLLFRKPTMKKRNGVVCNILEVTEVEVIFGIAYVVVVLSGQAYEEGIYLVAGLYYCS